MEIIDFISWFHVVWIRWVEHKTCDLYVSRIQALAGVKIESIWSMDSIAEPAIMRSRFGFCVDQCPECDRIQLHHAATIGEMLSFIYLYNFHTMPASLGSAFGLFD